MQFKLQHRQLEQDTQMAKFNSKYNHIFKSTTSAKVPTSKNYKWNKLKILMNSQSSFKQMDKFSLEPKLFDGKPRSKSDSLSDTQKKNGTSTSARKIHPPSTTVQINPPDNLAKYNNSRNQLKTSITTTTEEWKKMKWVDHADVVWRL